jgi:hypothetical protein
MSVGQVQAELASGVKDLARMQGILSLLHLRQAAF